jgi:hypothetical protein
MPRTVAMKDMYLPCTYLDLGNIMSAIHGQLRVAQADCTRPAALFAIIECLGR